MGPDWATSREALREIPQFGGCAPNHPKEDLVHGRTPFTVVWSTLIAASFLTLAPPAQATFSIVARDSVTGDIGVAVQSHYFAVGPIVPWAEPGVGAVATQSLVEVSYGPKGLQMMRDGRSAKQALQELLAQDQYRDVRQVAMIDADGSVADRKSVV